MVIVICPLCGSPNCIEPADEVQIEYMKRLKCHCCEEEMRITRELKDYVIETRKMDKYEN